MGALQEAGLGAAEDKGFSKTSRPPSSRTMRTNNSLRCSDESAGRWPLRLFSCTWRCPLEPSTGPRDTVELCAS